MFFNSDYNHHMDAEVAYNLALDYLYSFVDYSLKHVSELAKADFNLERMFALMEALGRPQQAYPIVHVAGTKGKGSTCALCASALTAAGYKTGLYTSPHLQDYCERIQVDGTPLAHEQLAALVDAIKPAVAKIPKLTTFEITTAVGLLAFQRAGVEAAVVEVGLGGRLDATNVVRPRVSVITSLSLDHMAVLGDTLAKIAGEKAGIIKTGVPVVSSPQKEEAYEVLVRVAGERGASLSMVGRDVKFELLGSTLEGQSIRMTDVGRAAKLDVSLPLLGGHQMINASTAYLALKTSGLPVSDEAIQKGFSQVKWPARFELVRREPPIIFDSAHNDDSFARLRETLEAHFPGREVTLIFGASEDKNIPGMFREIKPKLGRILITRAEHPRALGIEIIQGLADQAEVPHEAVTPVRAALRRALELSAKDGSIVLSAGSMFVTAEVMAEWKKINK